MKRISWASQRGVLNTWALTVLLFVFAARAGADESGAQLNALLDGVEVPLPTLRSDFEVGLRGDLASVVLTQVFANPYEVPVHARYIFPLPTNAAVHAMRLISGDEMIEAEIRTKPEARAVFQEAKTRGHQAALLNQERPNVFTQEVANLTPGAEVRIELEYAHVVEKSRDAYRFHIPTVVGPRFVPAGAASSGAPSAEPDEPAALKIGVWTLPATPPVASPAKVDRERLSIRIDLDAGVPIQWLESPSHPLAVDTVSDTQHVIELADQRTLDNQDFELHYGLAGEEVVAGATTFAENGEGFVSLLIEPPIEAGDTVITPREMVFVLDCSGSMGGTPLAASKRFMRRTLQEMRASDSFRIIRFSDSATEWSERPMRATPNNLREGQRYVDGLFGGGGTHMSSGIRAALAPPVEAGMLRIVVFLTDGYIGNDIEVVRLLEQQRGDARLFSFGIGNSVNRYLIEEMGRAGRGAARIVRPNEEADLAADELVERLAAPILTDIEVDWGDAAVSDAFPREIPDLFLGQTLRVMARYKSEGAGATGFPAHINVRGKIASAPVELPLLVELPVHNDDAAGEALPIVWARAQVEDRMIEYLRPDLRGEERDAIQTRVTELGLRHRLMTQWTSFVAVTKRVVNPNGEGRGVDVAVPQVKDVPNTAYPPGAVPGAAPGQLASATSLRASGALGAGAFNAHSGPEPATWAALLAIGLLVGARCLWSRRRAASN